MHAQTLKHTCTHRHTRTKHTHTHTHTRNTQTTLLAARSATPRVKPARATSQHSTHARGAAAAATRAPACSQRTSLKPRGHGVTPAHGHGPARARANTSTQTMTRMRPRAWEGRPRSCSTQRTRHTAVCICGRHTPNAPDKTALPKRPHSTQRRRGNNTLVPTTQQHSLHTHPPGRARATQPRRLARRARGPEPITPFCPENTAPRAPTRRDTCQVDTSRGVCHPKASLSILSPGQGLRTRAKCTTGKQGLRYTPRPEAPHYYPALTRTGSRS
jgi:hypothetical protein